MAQTWDVTLYTYVPAAGYGDTVSAGYGDATAAQAWPITLFDGTAQGFGTNDSDGYGAAEGAGEVVWYDIDVAVLVEGATRPFLAPLDIGNVLAPLDVAHVLAPLDVATVLAPLDIGVVFAPLDMETEV